MITYGEAVPMMLTPALEMAVEGVRALNQATATGGYQRPSDVYAVVVELSILVRALPRALGQAATWLEAEHEAGRLGCDDGHNLTLTVHATSMGLHDATRHTKPLLRALNGAVQHASHLTGRP